MTRLLPWRSGNNARKIFPEYYMIPTMGCEAGCRLLWIISLVTNHVGVLTRFFILTLFDYLL
ncbi:hypothetical protein BDV40DRAFT_254952 [Aspergillus tamarii]|uniref:Uncharacterized protein n=1 Tax=Aspergillus tamarii TaxID=41984 RepID=A0A5N6V6B2_ASPTM|nr:hypothetical protein BDV40DRAFT_254952 [Aspergillus tamarii]